VSQVLRQALLEEPDPERRRVLCNLIIGLLSGPAGTPRKSHLEKLTLERTSRHCFKNLVIATTGTGKTVIAAFDYQRLKNSDKSGGIFLTPKYCGQAEAFCLY
jgi:Cdc6-like AAA superfamily ATPase